MRPAVRRLLAALLTATAATAASPAVAAPDFAVTAHRGGPTRLLGENTMAAFRNALADGATAVEADVRRTFDDRLVVLHDSGLGRTTTCTGPIGAWTRARLDRECLEQKSRRPVPHLEELLAFAARRQVSLMVELKGSNWSSGQVRHVVDLVRSAGAIDLVAVSSLRVTVLERVRRLAPRLGTQLIVGGWRKVRESRGRVDGYNVPAGVLTRRRVEALHRRGVRVVGGLGESSGDRSWLRDWARYARVGVDGVVTDRVPAYRSWLG